MTLYELRELFVDDLQLVRVYDCGGDDVKTLFEGDFSDLPSELEWVEISSLDNVYKNNDGYFGINVVLDKMKILIDGGK